MNCIQEKVHGLTHTTSAGISNMASNLNGCSFSTNLWLKAFPGINTHAHIINRTNQGMKVIDELNTHNFPLDMASVKILLDQELNSHYRLCGHNIIKRNEIVFS